MALVPPRPDGEVPVPEVGGPWFIGRAVSIIAGTLSFGFIALEVLFDRLPALSARRGMFDGVSLIVLSLVGLWLALFRPMRTRNLEQQRELAEAISTLRRFRFAFTSVDQSVVISDCSGVILEVNPSFTRLFGYSAEEVRGRRTSVLSSGVHQPEFYRELWACLARGQTWEGRVVDRASSGELLEVMMSIAPLRDERGTLQGYVSVHRDLRAANEHERLQREALEQRSRAAAEMEELKVRAEAASAAKSRFLATMSHEIRTPVAGVLGTLELLSSEHLTPNQQHLADLALVSSRALQGVLNDVLDFSRIEAGHFVLEAAHFDVTLLANEVRELFLAQAWQKGLSLEVSSSSAVGELWAKGDPVRVRQVLSNLVGNAVKFTESGAVRLRVDALRAPGEVTLSFRVEDTGVGIAAEHRAKLFNPFTQVDASFRRRFGGTGLGLTISRRLAEAMGGTLELEKQQGVGSVFTFRVTLPLSASLASAPKVALTQAELAGVEGLRVLVAEDNPINQLVVTRLLRRLGCEVVAAENGVIALDLLQRRTFDLILMDCQMPLLDGLETTRRIRASSDPWTSIPVVALTANAFVEDREACLAAGMNGFLTKPVQESVLVRALLAATSRQRVLRLVAG